MYVGGAAAVLLVVAGILGVGFTLKATLSRLDVAVANTSIGEEHDPALIGVHGEGAASGTDLARPHWLGMGIEEPAHSRQHTTRKWQVPMKSGKRRFQPAGRRKDPPTTTTEEETESEDATEETTEEEEMPSTTSAPTAKRTIQWYRATARTKKKLKVSYKVAADGDHRTHDQFEDERRKKSHLDSTRVFTRQETSEKKATETPRSPPPKVIGPARYPEMSHPLLCTVSSLAVEELRYPHQYCSHIIYTHAEFNFAKKSFVAPMSSLSFATFLRSLHRRSNGTRGPRYLVSLSQAFVERNLREMDDPHTPGAMLAWIVEHELSGMAFMEHVIVMENVPFYTSFSWAFKTAQPKSYEMIIGFSSPDLAVLKSKIGRLSNLVDYIVLETHVKQFPDNCIAMFPTAFNKSRNPKVLQLTKNLFPIAALRFMPQLPSGKGKAKTCVSILMAVLMYVVPQGLLHAPSQDCIDFSWCTYSEVCHEKPAFRYYEWAEAVVQSIQSRMYMFDDETTVVNKVRKVQQLSPKTCISLYRADLDDYSGTCNRGTPFLRVAAVRQAVDGKTA